MNLRRKNILLAALALVLGPGLARADQNPDKALEARYGPYGRGILWKVEKAGGSRPSYVFGTIHINDERVTNLPEPVARVMDACDSLSLELIISDLNPATLGRFMLLPPGASLRELLGQEYFDRVGEHFRSYGLPSALDLNRLKPWAIWMMLNSPRVGNSGNGPTLDASLEIRARKRGAKVYGLEKPDEQVSVFDGMPLTHQVYFLKNLLNARDEMGDDATASYRKSLEELTRHYLNRDLYAVLMMNEKESAGVTPDPIMVDFSRRLLLDRNVRMVERMGTRLNEGNACVAVGALHLPGYMGVLDLLRKQGHTLTRVY